MSTGNAPFAGTLAQCRGAMNSCPKKNNVSGYRDHFLTLPNANPERRPIAAAPHHGEMYGQVQQTSNAGSNGSSNASGCASVRVQVR
jgi:hypothetical protein